MVWSEKLETNLRNIDAYHNGRYEGKEEGKVEGKAEMIINMKNKNIDINTIAECANMTKKEVQDIIDNYQVDN